MLELKKITTFLNNLTAVSQTHYQIWDYRGRKIFSTDSQKIDFLTTSYHLKMAKRVIQSNAFTYTPTAHNGFLCGIPLEMDTKAKGAILALGPLQATTNDQEHPNQWHQLLLQIVMMGQNGNNNGHDHSHKIPCRHHDSGFDDLFLVANISKQFRSLRFKQPILGKLMHRLFDSMDADAVFLQLSQMPQYNLLDVRPDLLKKNGQNNAIKDQFQQLITSGTAQCKGNYRIVNNAVADDQFEAASDRPYRFIAVAVRHMKTMYGWLGLVSYHTNTEFKSEKLTILQTLANQLALILANMEQHDDLERFTINIVCSLVNAIEAKDAYTRGHSKRVHQYAMQIARHIDLSDEALEALKWAAVLHDIGKIGIPERILCKPGKLTDHEFDLIKQHPIKGKTILSPIKQLAASMKAIAHHHEKYDGTGYPDKLKGEKIPLSARIIAVADTFDAVTSARSYHAAKTTQDALLELHRVAGAQLDPNLVKIFSEAYQHGQK